MKKGGNMIRLSMIVICLVSNILFASHTKLSMQHAVRLKLIKTSGISLGGHQGFCIKVTVENLRNDSLAIVIEAGQRLNSVNDQLQDILVVKDEIVYLKCREVKSLNVKGYCCQSNN